jgi:phosphate transport system protein
MHRHFEDSLDVLKERILRMGSLAEEMIQKAVRAMRERDSQLPEEVFALEHQVNDMHIEIDDRCLKLLATQQPMAADLRFITAAMKINADLERVADQAVNVSQTCYYHLFKEAPVPQVGLVTKMAEISQGMVKDSLDAFSKKDVALARSVLARDEEEDELKRRTISDCIELIQKEPAHSKQLVDVILLSKNMERIGDHATNIAEDVIFMALGKDIRHHREDRASS